ncbi:uncharacterized protein LAESUDRAFT_657375 [Laetiporus sulphureus 93-53]|uniref:GmrSD restriction endonucleases N-terminal domain-containing protein n=1 Tax=Laetiporus sulphureus 93-53 TaxID=1314785 RepID=A0A165DDL6_9APHY|nr:uncharacterized protein LAESUDRAFT_657375 [Laetiporus sulphureus 93-53]KZT04641.1 hypothetical protein LAESUDRAFT_657375 [Laetiporus sulphureus 93-53]
MEQHKDYDELISDIDDDTDENLFHIGDRLDPPEARLYSTQQLHTLIHEGVIDLAPPYQRDIVWTEPKQMKLLDSIYRNFYVPPVVFAVVIEDGEQVRRCVDGKQRLTSIQKFFDGQVSHSSYFASRHKDPITKKSWWYTRAESQKGSRFEVPEQWKRDFASKQITCVEYKNLPRGFERDIFQRVQLGMPLTAAEKLQAIASPWADWISDLDAQFISNDDGLTTKIDVDMKRGRDFQSLAQLVYCCDNYPEHSTPTAQKMEQWVSRAEAPSPAFKTAIGNVLTKFWYLADSPDYNHAFKNIHKRVAPIEFVFIGVLLFALRDLGESKSADRVRAQELYNMRTHIRNRYADVRSRSDIIRALWEFVQELVERTDAEDVHKKSKKKKRKDHMDVDEDHHSSAKRPKGKAAQW